MQYIDFIKRKQIADVPTGFDADIPVGPLFDFQAACVKWALKRGRAALFLDTGLGKTLSQVTWAQLVCEHTGGNVIIAAPLCVSQQTVEEAAKFGITVKYCREDDEVEPGITITNYEMLEHFDLDSFVGVVLDESSILKAHTSKTRAYITEQFRATPYKLSCTATPSPNDFMELGNQSEFLGVMSAQEMLATFFTHDGGDTGKWRLKGHGKVKFWEWMASWAICIRNPSDLGFDGSRYELPPIKIVEHVVSGGELIEGQLFAITAQTLTERRQAKKSSMDDRMRVVYEIAVRNGHVEAGVCGNEEGELSAEPRGEGEATSSSCNQQGSTEEIHGGVSGKEHGEVETNPGATAEDQRNTPKEVCGERGIQGVSKGEVKGVAGFESGEASRSENQEVRTDSGGILRNDGETKPSMCYLRPLGQVAEENISDDRSLPSNGSCSRDSLLELQHGAREVQGQYRANGEGNRVLEKKPLLIWCHLNDEQDELERYFGDQCFSVRGADSNESKTKSIHGWLKQERPVMISKASIMGFGLNFQHCDTMIFAGMDDSFEKYYQAVRRCHRFGQKKQVTVHIITAETEGAVKANIERKQAQANEMAEKMIDRMRQITKAQIIGARSNTETYNPNLPMTIPAWLKEAA